MGAQAAGEPVPPAVDDARLDVKSMIRQASRPVPVYDLVRRGTRTISVLSRQKMDEMVNQAVQNIVAKYRALAIPREQIELESHEEFAELFAGYQETARARSTLEATATSVSTEIEELRRELERQKSIADGRLAEEAELSKHTWLAKLEEEIDRSATSAFERRRALLVEGGETPEGIAEFGRIEQRIRAILSRLYEEQRRVAHARDVALLEKRLAKACAQLKMMEGALKAISSQKLLTNNSIQNLLRGLGLWEDDKYAERRKGMLKIVLQQNIKLRHDLKEFQSKQAAQSAVGVNGRPEASGEQ